MNKAQTAVPTILLSLMALIVWYVLWLYPQQRYELLFGVEDVNADSIPEVTYIYSTIVGEIGQSSGQLLDSQFVSNLRVSYPVTRSLISEFSPQILTASLLTNEYKTVDLSRTSADKVSVEVVSSSIIGSPKLKISLNNTLLYDNELIPDSKITLDVPRSNINTYGSVLRISCNFNGWQFWTVQQCGINSINVYDYVFAPVDTSDKDIFYLTPNSVYAKLVELNFTPTQATNYPVIIEINGNQVFQGVLQTEENILSLDGDKLGLKIDNNITLTALEGAEYVLSDINMNFYSVPSGLAAKYLIFDVPGKTLTRKDSLDVIFNIEGIIEPGNLNIDIINTGAKYVVTSDKLVLGTNRIQLLTNDLDEYGNNLKIYSSNGRLIIGELNIN